MPLASPFLIDATRVCGYLLSHSVVTLTRAASFASVATGRKSRRASLNFPAGRSLISAAAYVLLAIIVVTLILLSSNCF